MAAAAPGVYSICSYGDSVLLGGATDVTLQHLSGSAERPLAGQLGSTAGIVRTLACCDEHRYVAISTDAKKLTVWDTRAGQPDGSWVCLLERETSKKLNALRFVRRYHGVEAGSGSIGLVVADRMGDVYVFHVNCDISSTAGAEERTDTATDFLAGHLSTVTAMDFTADESFMITAERDEKIRVSHFPNSYNIEAFCLGHTCHVSALAVATLEEDATSVQLLLSGGVDGSLRLWSLPDSEPLYSVVLELPPAAAENGAAAAASAGAQIADEKPARKPYHTNNPVTHNGSVAVDSIAYSKAAGVAAVSFSGSKMLAVVVIQPRAPASAGGGGSSSNHCYQVAVMQWVELQNPPSTGALAFGGADGATLFVGAVGEEAPAVFARQNGAFLPVA